MKFSDNPAVNIILNHQHHGTRGQECCMVEGIDTPMTEYEHAEHVVALIEALPTDQPTAPHLHPDGMFCDDCPDALLRNVERLLTTYRGLGTDDLAGMLAEVLTDLGWRRHAPELRERLASAEKPLRRPR